MQIVVEKPPNYAEIVKKFPAAAQMGTIFSWGDRIYNPSGAKIHPALYQHELVHGSRQNTSVQDWWKRYLHDTEFRLNEEIPAHIAEWRWWLASDAGRNVRRQILQQISGRLASSLYGSMLNRQRARDILKELT